MNKEELKQYEYIEKLKDIIKIKYDKKPTCTVITFGCQMNAKDSEKLIGILEKIGFENINNEEQADFVIYNTCTVRENANEKLYGHIGQLKKHYYENKNKIIGICGCMMQEKDEVIKIQEKYPYIKLIFGTHNVGKFAQLLYELYTNGKKVIRVEDKMEEIIEDLPLDRKYSFKCGINISYGCNNFCSYCIVPYVRGREKSRNKEDILSEVKKAVSDGVIEVMLLGQNVNSYGNDLGLKNAFPQLLQEVANIDGLKRVRFMTSHPKDFSDELIDVIKNNDKICKHIHLPIQSGSNRILELMNRKYTREHYLEIIDKIKQNIKDVLISTDIIVGFPTETEEDFEDTIDIIKKVRFNNVFTFKYSKRTGTKAAEMTDQVDEKVVDKRFQRLLDTVKNISNDELEKYINTNQEILVEEYDDKKNIYAGRLSNNVLVYFAYDKNLIGKLVDIRIVENKGFYLQGKII